MYKINITKVFAIFAIIAFSIVEVQFVNNGFSIAPEKVEARYIESELECTDFTSCETSLSCGESGSVMLCTLKCKSGGKVICEKDDDVGTED